MPPRPVSAEAAARAAEEAAAAAVASPRRLVIVKGGQPHAAIVVHVTPPPPSRKVSQREAGVLLASLLLVPAVTTAPAVMAPAVMAPAASAAPVAPTSSAAAAALATTAAPAARAIPATPAAPAAAPATPAAAAAVVATAARAASAVRSASATPAPVAAPVAAVQRNAAPAAGGGGRRGRVSPAPAPAPVAAPPPVNRVVQILNEIRNAAARSAAAAAAAAAAAGPAPLSTPVPVPDVDTSAKAFPGWLTATPHNGAAVLVKQVRQAMAADGTLMAPVVQDMVVFLGGLQSTTPSITHPTLMKAQQMCVDVRNAGGGRLSNARTSRLTQFANCSAIVLSETPLRRAEIGIFPVLPQYAGAGVPRSGGHDSTRTALVSYISITSPLTAEEIKSVPFATGAAAAELGGDADGETGRREKRWSETPGTHEIALKLLGELRMPAYVEGRLPEGIMRRAWARLMAVGVAGYAKETTSAEDKDRMLHMLLGAPRMFLQRLSGTATTRERNAYLVAQLAGNVCEQKNLVRQRVQRPPEDVTLEEHGFKCVKKSFEHCVKGHLSRASSTLVRPMPVLVDPAVRLRDFVKLHPASAVLTPEQLPALPVVPFFNKSNVNVTMLRDIVSHSLSGSAPGPDGWTFELLFDALQEPDFAHDFAAMVTDICNGNVSDRTAIYLASSRLAGIPKGATPADGTRPLALGSVILKVAATCAVKAESKNLQAYFRGRQYGCAYKGGGEAIVHWTRRFLRTGVRPPTGDGTVSAAAAAPAGPERCVVLIDCSNAFNELSRVAMADAVRNFPGLAGIFHVSYKQQAPLHLVDGSATLLSQTGSRQGTVEGPPLFAAAMQQVLIAVAKCAGVHTVAYLDDITVLADTVAAAEAAVAVLVAELGKIGLRVNSKKSELLVASSSFTVDAAVAFGTHLRHFQRPREPVVKLLGASIGLNDDVEMAHLMAREGGKAATFCERIKHGASPQFFHMLRLCGLPQLSYHIRVHSAAVTAPLCKAFDARFLAVFLYWSSMSSLSTEQLLIMSLPREHGGMGLTRTELVASAAYHASLTTALGTGRMISQAKLTGAIMLDYVQRACQSSPRLGRTLQVTSMRGADAGLACLYARVHPDVFGALLRNIVDGSNTTFTNARVKSIACPGCKRLFNTLDGAWGQHVSACVTIPGGHVTARHQAVVALLRSWMAEAGWQPDMREPRDLATYTCGCGRILSHDAYIEHRKKDSCTGKALPLHTSGPDLRFRENGRVVVADVTIHNSLLASHASETPDETLEAARKIKYDSYGAKCAAAGAKFLPLPALANGHLGHELVALINRLAAPLFRNPFTMREEVSATIAHGGAVTRLAAEQRAGYGPPSIDAEQVALVDKYRHVPSNVETPTKDERGGLLPTPAAPHVLPMEQAARIFAECMRGLVPTIAATIVDAIRKEEGDADKARRTEREMERRTASIEAVEERTRNPSVKAIGRPSLERALLGAQLDVLSGTAAAEAATRDTADDMRQRILATAAKAQRDVEALKQRHSDAVRDACEEVENAGQFAALAEERSERVYAMAAANLTAAEKTMAELDAAQAATEDELFTSRGESVTLRDDAIKAARSSAAAVARALSAQASVDGRVRELSVRIEQAALDAADTLEYLSETCDNVVATGERLREVSVSHRESLARSVSPSVGDARPDVGGCTAMRQPPPFADEQQNPADTRGHWTDGAGSGESPAAAEQHRDGDYNNGRRRGVSYSHQRAQPMVHSPRGFSVAPPTTCLRGNSRSGSRANDNYNNNNDTPSPAVARGLGQLPINTHPQAATNHAARCSGQRVAAAAAATAGPVAPANANAFKVTRTSTTSRAGAGRDPAVRGSSMFREETPPARGCSADAAAPTPTREQSPAASTNDAATYRPPSRRTTTSRPSVNAYLGPIPPASSSDIDSGSGSEADYASHQTPAQRARSVSSSSIAAATRSARSTGNLLPISTPLQAVPDARAAERSPGSGRNPLAVAWSALVRAVSPAAATPPSGTH